MGGVIRDDGKAVSKCLLYQDKTVSRTVSKTDIKTQDNGDMCRISTPCDKWDWEMTQSLCNDQRPASGNSNCDGQNHSLVFVSRGFRLSRKKAGQGLSPVSKKSLFRYAKKEFHIHSKELVYSY